MKAFCTIIIIVVCVVILRKYSMGFIFGFLPYKDKINITVYINNQNNKEKSR